MNKPLFIYKPDIEKMKKLNADVAKKYPLLTYMIENMLKQEKKIKAKSKK